MATSAAAQSTFHVKEFDYGKGKWIFETVNAYHGGLTPLSARVQGGHELGLAYAVTSWWLPKILISFDKDEGRAYEVQRLLFENTITFKPLAENTNGVGFAWFQSLEGALSNRQTNVTLFGPIITAQMGKFSFSTNTFFEKTFGQNHTEGMNFLYALQARYEIMDKVKLAFEAYGFVPEIGAGRTFNVGLQNRIGPALILEVELPGAGRGGMGGGMAGRTSVKNAAAPGKPEAAHAEIELGVLFGTTEYTPDVTGKANMHIKF